MHEWEGKVNSRVTREEKREKEMHVLDGMNLKATRPNLTGSHLLATVALPRARGLLLHGLGSQHLV